MTLPLPPAPPAPFEISTDRARLDVGLVHWFLSGSSYWAQGRSREDVETCIAGSLCFGAYQLSAQVGFCRVVTDRVVFAYLLDMFVVPECRGHGVGGMLLRAVIDHPSLAKVPGIQLRTRDARAFYERFGFQPVARAHELLVRPRSPPAGARAAGGTNTSR